MAISLETRAEAFAMYMQGIPYGVICDMLKIKSVSTISMWVRKYGWEKKKHDITKIAFETGIKSTKERHKHLTQVIQNLAMKKVKSFQKKAVLDTSNKDLMEAIKLERLLEGEATEIIKNLYNPLEGLINEFRTARNKNVRKPTDAKDTP